ncbi:MAG: hypothetical protein KZQ63_05660 [Candidatus Thiodiazotropha sp. (ex Lucinoma aequizonata)]|nr:hypothetical protein [Candidatus Thiodiazotropha sp. (ex Lucinoma aequizonata)]
MINVPDRRRIVELIEEAVDAAAPAQKASEELEISLRTYKRWTEMMGSRPMADRMLNARSLRRN